MLLAALLLCVLGLWLISCEPDLLQLFLHLNVVGQLLEMILRDVISHLVYAVDMVECFLGHFGVERIHGRSTVSSLMTSHADVSHHVVYIVILPFSRWIVLASVRVLVLSMDDGTRRLFRIRSTLVHSFGLPDQHSLQIFLWPVILISIGALEDFLIMHLVIQSVEIVIVWTLRRSRGSLLSPVTCGHAAVHLSLSSPGLRRHSDVSRL